MAVREELLRAGATPTENEEEETTLRPRHLAEFVGQASLREHLEIVLGAARQRGQAADHLLFAGPPGLGKTSLAGIVAAEMGTGFRVTSGPALERSGDLAAILTNLDEGDVLFIDEIHRLPRVVEEVLYPAMEDFCLDIVIGKGPSARALGGNRVGLPTLAVSVGEEPEPVETVYEPYRLKEGFLQRTPRGRVATAAAFAHLGVALPAERATPDGATLFEG